jgi:outer membrane protein OmpA-like peptidoglycan-associated protein
VKAWLVARGGASDRIRVESLGEHQPLNTAHDAAAWAENRRVTTRSIVAVSWR